VTPPRPYRSPARAAAADDTRARVLAAARELLADPGGLAAFTLDAVARRASVTRVTVYNQFGNRSGLIEAVFDTLAIVRHGVEKLIAALKHPDPVETLSRMIAVFGRVWDEDRAVIRRLQGLAALDPEFQAVWQARESRRRFGLGTVVARASEQRGVPAAADVEAVTDVLFAIVAFETYDVIAGEGRTLEHAVPIVLRLALTELGIER
jgi:AcrR family transcriptional regulator